MLRKILSWTLAIVLVLAAGIYAAFQFSPWPSALYFRHLMDKGGTLAGEALARHVPAGIAAHRDLRYDPRDRDALLDVFYPSDVEIAGSRLPAVVWVHGGGFISGGRNQIDNYLMVLAGRGFVAVGVDYSLAPGARYPTPVRQVNAALAWLEANADRLHIDPSRLFLAGDSAGAQIAGQTAIVVSEPAYAAAVGIEPGIGRAQLRGVILHCGFLFFPDDYQPPLPHEYQFNLDIEAGRTALERSVAFLAERSR